MLGINFTNGKCAPESLGAGQAEIMRRFPPPWTIEALDAGYKVVDANGQVLAYVYGLDDSRDARIAKSLTRTSNIAKLPMLGGKG